MYNIKLIKLHSCKSILKISDEQFATCPPVSSVPLVDVMVEPTQGSAQTSLFYLPLCHEHAVQNMKELFSHCTQSQ